MRSIFVILFFSCVSGFGNNFTELINRHCYECHNPKNEKGDVDLTLFQSPKDFYLYYDLLKDVYSQLKSGDMPPEEDSKMSEGDRRELVDYLASVIHNLENKASNKTGSTQIRRLTDYEYDNSVKEVTGLDLKLSENFPSSGGGSEGFQNDSAILSVSPLLFEKYLTAAETISTYSHFDLHTGFSFSTPESQPESKTATEARVRKEVAGLLAKFYPKNFSVERYLPKVMQAVNDFNMEGRSAEKLKELPKKYGINEHIIRRGIIYFSNTNNKTIMERDALRSWFLLKQEKFDQKKAQDYSREFVKVYEESMSLLKSLDGVKKKNYQIFKDNINEIFDFTDQEVSSMVDAATFKKYSESKMLLDFLEKGLRTRYKREIALLLIPHVRTFMQSAFRKPPEESEVLLMTKDLMETSKEFGLAIAARILVIRTFASMKFTYRHEDKTGKPAKVTDYELASRLSYFLWASPPDKELMKLAGEKKLSQPAILEQQVKRMLKDRKSSGLAKYFASHWLMFDEIIGHEGTSTEKFPQFTPELAKDMWLESAICFEYIVKNDRSVLEVIDADYTFLNGRLKRHYGLGDGSSKFSKVMLRDRRRGGITGHASVLTLTSAALRTSPILRGNWVNQALLGTPTPPAPANVEPLPNEEVVSKDLTLKKQLESHRKSPQCKGCHQKIDPLGFPLENFDPIGRWRERYEKAPVDAHGELSDGKTIEGPEGLKKHLLREKENYLRHMSRKLLAYALGRSIEYYDFYIINEMVSSLKENDFKFSSMVLKIVGSYQFQHKN